MASEPTERATAAAGSNHQTGSGEMAKRNRTATHPVAKSTRPPDPARDRIPRNKAIEIYGKAKFRAAWVGERSTEEYELTQKYKIVNGRRPPVPAELVDKLYVAEERSARQDRQHREAIHWLENHGMDCVRGLAEGVDRKTFEAAFAREFGRSPPSGAKRGPRQKDFWPRVENYIFDLLVKHGPPSPDDPDLPDQQALEELVANFMQTKGWDAAESTIRKHVADMLEYWGTLGR